MIKPSSATYDLEGCDPSMMPRGSYLRFQQAGEKALQEKRFKTAKTAFDNALVQTSRNPKNDSGVLNSILDLRVEVQIRLKESNAALRDAQTMIRNDRGDPRGYLRCGQLCRWKNDYEGAQKWYDQGLKHVSKTNQYYATLESMSLKTAGKLGAALKSKFRDPLVVLPMEIVHLLWEYLGFRQAVACLRVSRIWRDILLAIPSIWKTLDLVGAQKNVTLIHAKACIRRLQTSPTTVRLDKLTGPAMTYVQPYIELWKTIEHFSINIGPLTESGCSWALPSAIKSLHLGQQWPVSVYLVDNILRRFDILQNARFDHVVKSFQQSNQSPAQSLIAYEAPQLQHRNRILPELTHLVVSAKQSSNSEFDLLELVSNNLS